MAGPSGAAVESCAYDPAARTLKASIAPGGTATLKVTAGGALLFGADPAPCGGATTTNTDSISLTGSAGTVERFVLDQSDGFLGPGFTPEHNFPEIEMATALGDTTDEVVIYGTEGDDVIASGQNGVALNADGDLDISFSPNAFRLEIHALGGKNFINGRGQGGAGLAFTGPLTIYGGDLGDELVGSHRADRIYGGAGNDVIYAHGENDVVHGLGGDDLISAGEADDLVVGGPGVDSLLGGYGDDTLDANDGEADAQIHGGPGADTALYDAGLDPATTAVETKVADPGEEPEPPASGTCAYNAALRTVTAAAGEGVSTLAVDGGALVFGATPAPCGRASTANTDTIVVLGSSGKHERLVVDLSGGPLAPGATAEATGTSEIELAANLGDASDEIVVVGTSGDDVLAAGTKGVALNADADADLSLAVPPAVLELAGGGGRNLLTARGGFGAGQVFSGAVILRAGDQGDELTGSNLDDLIVGGSGDDVVNASAGDDDVRGGAGADKLNGQDGDDALVGGPGPDSLSGGYGNDLLVADDGELDPVLNGGGGVDTASYDGGLDPVPAGVENRLPR